LGAVFFLLSVLINSRFGRNLEEVLVDWGVESWHRFGIRFAVGLFWWSADLFRHLVQGIERLTYTVDEWLRFKSGQSYLMMFLKGSLGTIWFFMAYAVRFCVNLLIEPQLNPVKHVPWVTVSHKILAPMWIAMDLRGVLAQHMNTAMADVMTFLIVTLTPGIFGYLIWELKENWRLFAANRLKTLDAVLVGSHGETLPRLLRPGLHSGTIPKRFAKLSRAERKVVMAGGDPQAVRKHREVLHHVAVDLRRYVEREFVVWFVVARGWHGPLPQVGEIRLATNEISVEIDMPSMLEGPLVMAFELTGGRTHLQLSGKIRPGCFSESARKVFCGAIVNVLKTGSVEVFDCSDGTMPGNGVLPPREVGAWPVPWPQWVAAWENERGLLDNPPWDRLCRV
jgi:hypothetical protein